MKKIIFCSIIASLLFNLNAFGQDSDVEKLLDKGDYSKAMTFINSTYANDTNNANRFYDMYLYYIDAQNPEGDSLKALDYAQQYNKNKENGKDISVSTLAKNMLTMVYKRQDIDMLNYYINISDDFPQLQSEAERVRDRLAFEKVEKSGRIEEYEKFIASYPNAMQTDQARLWLNEHLINEILESNDIDKLKNFVSSTTNETYKKQALREIDKLSFRQALKENSIEAYETYIREFPNGDYIQRAKSNREEAQRERYVNEGHIAEMMSFLRENSKSEANYQLIFDKLRLKAFEQYSLPAIVLLDSIEHNENYLKSFAKRYISDLSLSSIEKLVQAFPALATADYIIEAETKAKTITNLLNKKNLSMEDYKKNKSLFMNLNARQTAILFRKFYELNAIQPKNKSIKFNLSSDANFINFKHAQQTDLNLVLTDAPANENFNKADIRSLGFDFEVTDAYISSDKQELVFSMASLDGFDSKEGADNKDIYYSLYKNGKWQKPTLLSFPLNTRFNECNPVLSEDKKTLWFSSNRGLNFGNLDVYISHREDINDWTAWSEPVLLGEDINTIDNDYVIGVKNNMLILSQDENFALENNIYLEGNTNLNFISGEIKTNNNDFSNVYVCVMESKDYNCIYKTITNSRGGFAFLKPQTNYVLCAKKSGYYAPLSEQNNITLHYIDELVTNGELLTIKTVFNEKKPLELTPKGEEDLKHLSDIFKSKPYILTIEVHANNSYKKETPLSLSEKQADIIKEFLIKQGMEETQIITNGLGTEKVVQGWEGIDCIDIGFLSK